MRLHELAAELRMIADRGGGFGSDTETALRDIADALLLRPDGDTKELQRLLKPKAKTSAPKAAPQEPSALAKEYLSRLNGAAALHASEVIYAELLADKRVKAADAILIAKEFTGARSFKSKAVALDAIRERFSRRAWEKSGMEILKSQNAV